jgi:hypothetical protein
MGKGAYSRDCGTAVPLHRQGSAMVLLQNLLQN